MAELLAELKRYLDITWEDVHTDAKLSGILSRAVTKLRSYAGNSDLAFEAGSEELQLLLDMCRYVYNNASEDFETNYLADLIMFRAKYMVEAVKADESETADSSTCP